MYIQTTGLVLRETEYKESSRILTVLTSTEGKITVLAKGAKRKGSKTAASTQLLAFSEMTLFSQKDRYTLTEARSIELFRGLSEDLEKLALGSYFAELLENLSDEDIPNPEMLSLGLNALYALSEDKNSREIIKAAFELRLMCISGFEPLLESCSVCGRTDMEAPVLSLVGGVLCCAGCRSETEGERLLLSPGTLAAMRHIVRAEPKRLYSFKVSPETEKQLSKVCESYLLSQLGRSFGTLDFYRSLI
ncbi:MAG: DNA repair protein RecO [Oscillospiraceae bacterium]